MSDLELITENVVEGNVEEVKELTKNAIADGVDCCCTRSLGSVVNQGRGVARSGFLGLA